MINKKILLGILSIGMLAVVAAAGTYAFFDSSVSVTGNSVSAGTLDLLSVDSLGASASLQAFGASGIAPGTPIDGKTWRVKNTGNLAGTLEAQVTVTGASDIPSLTSTITDDASHTITINKDSATTFTVPLGTLNGGATRTFTTASVYNNLATSQNGEKGKSVSCDIVFYLKQV